MRIWSNRWRTRVICAIKIWLCAIFCVKNECQINWKCVHRVVLLCQYVEINTEQRVLAKGINFLFSFEENCFWIIPTTSRSLWWTCFVARYVWMMVLMFQKWWLRQKTRRKIRNMEKRQKSQRSGIASTVLMDKDNSQVQVQLSEQFNGLDSSLLVTHLESEYIHSSWFYCFTNPLELFNQVQQN